LNIYEAFETSDEFTNEGKWVEIEFNGSVLCAVQIRSASPELNADLRKAMNAEALEAVKNKDDLQDNALDPDRELRLFAAAVVTNWTGITDRKGKKLKCTPRNVEQVFKDLPLLFNRIKREAYRWTNFRKELEDEIVGNSRRSSAAESAESAATRT